MNGFARRFVLTQKQKRTRKWPIYIVLSCGFYYFVSLLDCRLVLENDSFYIILLALVLNSDSGFFPHFFRTDTRSQSVIRSKIETEKTIPQGGKGKIKQRESK